MNTLTYTTVRQNFRQAMDQVCDDHTPIIITRQNERPVVMISLEDYNAIEETLYLMKSPANAIRLLESVEDVRKQKLVKSDINLL